MKVKVTIEVIDERFSLTDHINSDITEEEIKETYYMLYNNITDMFVKETEQNNLSYRIKVEVT